MKNSNNNNFKKSHKAGSVIGVVLLILGSILTGILVYIISSAQSLPKILVAGPVILGVGISMFVFPGGDFTLKELNNKGSKKGIRFLWSCAPTLHKLVWIITGLIGLAISFKIMIDQGFLASL